MFKTFVSIIAEVGNKIWNHRTHNESMEFKESIEKDEEYDGGLGEPYSQRKWAENYYGKQYNNNVLKEDIDHL